jgi:hypothetical protein
MQRRRGLLGLAAIALAAGFCAFGDSRANEQRAPFWMSPIARGQAGVIAALAANESSNWSGYNQGFLEKGTLFTSVSGEWYVPAATQRTQGRAESSSAWVGIGGGCMESSCLMIDPTLIQAGTNSEVDDQGNPQYSTWWEIIPLPQIGTSLPVGPGDHMRVDIRQLVPAVWTITIENISAGQSVSELVPYASAYGTAEWILETPTLIGTSGVGTADMPNVGTVSFFNAQANDAAANLVPAEQIVLCVNGQVIGQPSAPTGPGSFNVTTYPGSGC